LLFATLLLLGFAALGLALKQEPEFMTRETIVLPQADDPHLASVTQTKLLELQNALEHPRPASGEWLIAFTTDELNAFLREDANQWNAVDPAIAPLHDLRASIDGDVISIGARNGKGLWSTVVWLELRTWLIPEEPNLVAIEIVSLRSGAIPLSKNWVMDRLTRWAGDRGAELNWYRGDANPIGVCRLRARLSQPDLLLKVLIVNDDRLSIGGKSLAAP